MIEICTDAWSCEDLPNGDVKCGGGYFSPDGKTDWNCHHDGEHIVCVKNEPNAVGGSNWDCEGNTCTGGGSNDSEAPPGGGTWICVTDDGKTTCTSNSSGDTPPGGGGYDCTVDGEHITCTKTGPGPNPDGGGTPDTGTTPPPDTGGGTADTGTPGPGPTPGGGLPPGDSPCWCAETPDPGWPAGEPMATILTQLTTSNGVPVLKARVVYSKNFCDNSYGVNSVGWPGKNGHKFGALVGSDHQVVYFHNCNGAAVATVQLDYITAEGSAPSGYDCLGPFGGDGNLLMGDPAQVVSWTSSLDVNLNDYGHVLTEDSPACDANYNVVDPQYSNWIFEMWYEVDIALTAFGSSGPCRVSIISLHASPAKTSSDTVPVVPCPC